MRTLNYLQHVPERTPDGVRLVHNFCPGPPQDPGRNRELGSDGFRAWLADEPGNERRCYCGWLDGREHYGTVGVVERDTDNEGRATP